MRICEENKRAIRDIGFFKGEVRGGGGGKYYKLACVVEQLGEQSKKSRIVYFQ